MSTQAEKAATFQALHARQRAFIIPNPWDAGSARVLAHLGFAALATTSSGQAFAAGRRDNTISREDTMAHLAAIAAATHLPVSADLGICFGDKPETVAETIRLAAQTGVVGGSVEDQSGDTANPIYAFDLAVDRVRAAAEAAHSLSFPFTLTARSENYLNGRPDLADTIRRLQAFQQAGADVLYAPGLMRREDIAEVVRSVDRPVNVLASLKGFPLTLADLDALGVRRVSTGGTLARYAVAALMRASREMLDRGTFSFAEEAAAPQEIREILGA